MARGKRLELVITGDASSAIASTVALDRATDRLDGNMVRHGASMGRSFDGVDRSGSRMGANVGRAMLGVGAAVGVGATAVGVAGLAVGAALYKIGSDFDEAYDNIRIATGATEARMEELKASFRSVAEDSASSFGDIGAAIADLEVRLPGLSDNQLETATAQFTNLARILDLDVGTAVENATQTLNMWGIATEALPSTMDLLFRATQQSGIGFDELNQQLAQYAPTLQELGFSFGDSVAMLAEFERSGVNVGQVMSGMSTGLRNMARDGEAPADTFSRLVEGIKDGTIGMGDAVGTFGRGAIPLFNAIREGRFDFENMGASILGAGDSINQAAHDTEDFSERFQRMKNRAFLALEPIAMRVFDEISAGMQRIMPTVSRLADEWGPHLERLGVWLGENIPVALDWLSQKINEVMPILRDIFAEVSAAVQENWPQIQETITTVINSITSVMESSISIWQSLWGWFGDDLLAGLSDRLDAVMQTLQGAFDFISGIFATFSALLRGDWSGVWEGIKQTLSGAADFLMGMTRLMWENVQTVFRGAGQVLGGIWFGIWGGIRTFFNGVWSGLVGAVRGMVSAIGSVWGGLKSAFSSVANWVINNVINKFIDAVNRVSSAVGLGNILTRLGNVGGGGSGYNAEEQRVRMHSGGIVTGTGEQDRTLMAGEGVIPVDVMRRMGARQFELLRQGKTDAIGDGLGFVDGIGASVADAVRRAAAEVARPMVQGALGLLGQVAPGAPGRMVAGGARRLGSGLLDWIAGTENLAKSIAPALSPGIGWEAMWQAVSKQFPNAQLHSGFRPGAITATGNKSYHSMGRAVDITPSMEIFDWLRSSFMAQTKELIFSPANGRQVHNGRDHMYSGVTRANHWDHVHWAMANGGYGTVREPTLFTAGDNGPEDFAFMPRGKGGLGGAGSVTVENHFHGPVNVDEEWFVATQEKAVRKGLVSA